MQSVKRCCEGCVISPANGSALRERRFSVSSTAKRGRIFCFGTLTNRSDQVAPLKIDGQRLCRSRGVNYMGTSASRGNPVGGMDGNGEAGTKRKITANWGGWRGPRWNSRRIGVRALLHRRQSIPVRQRGVGKAHRADRQRKRRHHLPSGRRGSS